MSSALEFFYDIGSPYSYLAAARIGGLARGAGVTVRWRPFLLGGVFKASGNTSTASVPAKGRFMFADLHRQAARYGVPFTFPSRFPLNTLLVQRLLCAAANIEGAVVGGADIEALSMTLFTAYWSQDANLSDPEVVQGLLGDQTHLLEAAVDPANKEALKTVTAEAVERGAFGAPTFFVGDDLYWGHDRLVEAIEAAQLQIADNAEFP